MLFNYQATYHPQPGEAERFSPDSSGDDNIDSLTSSHDNVDTVKLAGVRGVKGKHKSPTCETRPVSYSKTRLMIIGPNDQEISTDEELLWALQAGKTAPKRAYAPVQDASLLYRINAPSLGNDNPLSAGRQIEVICPDCAALTTVRLIEQAQGEDAAKEFMKSVMGGKKDYAENTRYGVQTDTPYKSPVRGAYALSPSKS